MKIGIKSAGIALRIIFISAIWVNYAFAGAWTVPKYKVWGEQYMKWNYAKDSFDESDQFTSQGNHVKNFRSWEFVMESKLEYGITDWLNFQTGLEYKEGHYKEYDRRVDWGSFVRKHHGITNVKLGGKWRLMENPFVFSAQGKVFIYPGYGIYHGDDGNVFRNQPSIGYGDDAFEWRFLIGKKFDMPVTSRYKPPFYFGAETGYRWRTGHVCNDIPYFFEIGAWPVPWLLVKTEIDGYKVHGGTGSIKEGYGVWRIGGAWQVFGDSTLRQGDKMFNIEFLYGMTLWGKNTTSYQEWTLKVQTQF